MLREIALEKEAKEEEDNMLNKTAESLSISTNATANIKKVYSILTTLKDVNLASTKGKVILSIVESVNVRGEPEKLIVVEFYPSKIVISYSVGNEPPSFRRWEVIRKVLPIVELVSEEYKLTISKLYPLLDKTIKEIDLELGKDIRSYYLEIDRLKRENDNLKTKLVFCKNEIDKLTSQVFDLTAKINELKIKLKKYETMNKELLKSKIVEWIREHDGEIDITEFSKVYKVKEQAVEQALNELIREGVISPL